jgi:hypothetical protein
MIRKNFVIVLRRKVRKPFASCEFIFHKWACSLQSNARGSDFPATPTPLWELSRKPLGTPHSLPLLTRQPRPPRQPRCNPPRPRTPVMTLNHDQTLN